MFSFEWIISATVSFATWFSIFSIRLRTPQHPPPSHTHTFVSVRLTFHKYKSNSKHFVGRMKAFKCEYYSQIFPRITSILLTPMLDSFYRNISHNTFSQAHKSHQHRSSDFSMLLSTLKTNLIGIWMDFVYYCFGRQSVIRFFTPYNIFYDFNTIIIAFSI